MISFTILLTCVFFLLLVHAQYPPVGVQNNTFNSTFTLTPGQIHQAGINSSFADAVETIARYERSQWAGGSVLDDGFYTAPANASSAPPGSILKVEQVTNTTLYTLPPGLALSRFIYQSETINGSVVPVSAFVLWPYIPREFTNISGVPVVAWSHGTSGFTADGAPSHIRDLWQQEYAPYPLALAGYAVVATDFAGLGVREYPNGTVITHPYLSNPSCAKDIVYSIQAAQQAWSGVLSQQYVTLGHSQGAGCTWGVAELMASGNVPMEGYLGGVTAAPVSDIISIFESEEGPNPVTFTGLLAGVAVTLTATLASSTYQITDLLTTAGASLINLVQSVQGVASVRGTLLTTPQTQVNPFWNTSSYMINFNTLVKTGGKPLKGPLLVMQGLSDMTISPNVTTPIVHKTCSVLANANSNNTQLQYEMFEGVDHNPIMFAGRLTWLNWIEDRFNGKPLKAANTNGSCYINTNTPTRPVTAYQKEVGSYLEWSEYPYQVY